MHEVHLKGYKRFKKEYFTDNQELFDSLSKGQEPHTMVITCSDSRVDPSKLLSTTPGDIFITRNIGNIVPLYETTKGATQAAIEYAVNALKVQHIIVLGHSACGACAHLYHETNEDDNHVELTHVENWLKIAYPAKYDAMLECLNDKSKNRAEITEKNNIKLSLQRLMTYPYIVKALENKTLHIQGWWYDIQRGTLEVYNYETKEFTPADA